MEILFIIYTYIKSILSFSGETDKQKGVLLNPDGPNTRECPPTQLRHSVRVMEKSQNV